MAIRGGKRGRVVGVLLLGLLLGAINAAWSSSPGFPNRRDPRMSSVAGCALLVLKTPGGASAQWLKDLVTGSLANEWIPRGAGSCS